MLRNVLAAWCTSGWSAAISSSKPCCAQRFANSKPMPDEAPVTIARPCVCFAMILPPSENRRGLQSRCRCAARSEAEPEPYWRVVAMETPRGLIFDGSLGDLGQEAARHERKVHAG